MDGKGLCPTCFREVTRRMEAKNTCSGPTDARDISMVDVDTVNAGYRIIDLELFKSHVSIYSDCACRSARENVRDI